MKLLKNEKASIVLIAIGILLLVFAVISFLWMDFDFSTSAQIKPDKWGQLGDFIGGIVGTLWALAGVLLFYIALVEQRKDIKINQKALTLQVEALNKQVEEFELQRKELKSSRKVYEQQTKTNRIQQFESHFYALLNVYLKIKDSLNNLDDNKDYFKFLYDQLRLEYAEGTDITRHHNNLIQAYVTLFNNHRGHLSHYFKCFYRLIKMIELNQFLEESEKVQYSKILRSQLTDYEQLIMQYNSYSAYGLKARPLILKYNLFKHVPIFQKTEFDFFSNIQDSFNLLDFSGYFTEFIIKNIKDSFDINFTQDELAIREDVFNCLVGIHFSDEIKIEVTCLKNIEDNGIKLSNNQFLEYLNNLVFEKIIFSTYTPPSKIEIKKYMTEKDNSRIFGIIIIVSEGVVLNLNYDNN